LTRAEDKAVANYVANEKAKGVNPKTQTTEGASGGTKGAANAHAPAKK
jgi:hypothetical protein